MSDKNYSKKFCIYIRKIEDPIFESIKNTFKIYEIDNVRFREEATFYTILVDEISADIPGFLTMRYKVKESDAIREVCLRLECIVAILKNIAPKSLGFSSSD